MKVNPQTSHFCLSLKTPKKGIFWWSLGRIKFNLLGIQVDSEFTFDEHICSICNDVGKKIAVLSRLVNYMSFDKRRMVMKAFIES